MGEITDTISNKILDFPFAFIRNLVLLHCWINKPVILRYAMLMPIYFYHDMRNMTIIRVYCTFVPQSKPPNLHKTYNICFAKSLVIGNVHGQYGHGPIVAEILGLLT